MSMHFRISKTLLLTCLKVALLGLCGLVALKAVEPDTICDDWITENGDARIRIVRRGDRYFGGIVALRHPEYAPGELDGMDGKPRVDWENPDKALRLRPLVGLEIVSNFVFKDGSWEGGTIYDAENGKTYSCKMKLGEDGSTLHVRGFIGFSLIGRTSDWQRASAYYKQTLEFLGKQGSPDGLAKKQ